MKFKKIPNIIGSPKIFVYLVIWLMFLVVIGTWAQRDYGLYIAQNKYFSSWFFLLFDLIPLPSGRLIMTLMTINLSCYFFKPNIFKQAKLGVTIVHSGVILLLVGGGLTGFFSTEGSMVIEEGSNSNFTENFYLKELAVVKTSDEFYDHFTIFDQPLLNVHSLLIDESLPFKIKVLEYFSNSEPTPRLYRGDSTLKGMARNFTLKEKIDEIEFEKNIPGIIYEVYDLKNQSLGIYMGYMGQPITQNISIDNSDYSIILRRERTYLPFDILLNDFKKVMHPGTNIAKSYSSDVLLTDGGVSRKVLIQMNEPLRYKGHTFYQASFIEGNGVDTTVLAVVKNYGRLFPYISTIIMCIGLLLHMLLKLNFKRVVK